MNYRVIASVVALVAIAVGIIRLLRPSCHSGVKYPIKYLSTKSPYIRVENLSFDFSPVEKSLQDVMPNECKAELIWIVARHGTRNPGEKTIRKMLKDLAKLRDEIIQSHSSADNPGQLCGTELEILKAWKSDRDLEPEKQKWLVKQGEEELYGIGSRLRQVFPEAFPAQYHPDVYKFKFTKTQRAEASAKSFARGILGEEAEKVVYPEALHADPILRFYKGCPRWKREVDKNPVTYEERIRFESSEPFRSMLVKLQNRLGLLRPISIVDVELIHQACAFETAWKPSNPSPWCSIFDEDDLEILEYRQDLEYYWVDGYGHELTYKQACLPLVDVMEQFSSKAANPKSPHKVTAYFTHSGTLLKYISHLGLFNDTEPLRSSTFEFHRNARKWKTSYIDKFATNIAFVLLRCSQGTGETLKVGTLFQEHPLMDSPFCRGNWICSLQEFEEHFKERVQNCYEDVASMCSI